MKLKKTKRVARARGNGTLIIIGGHEDKEDECEILREVVRRAAGGKIVVVTVASEEPEELWVEYRKCFKKLGVKRVERLDLEDAAQSRKINLEKVFKGTKALFFTGGDQLKITTKIAGSPLMDCLMAFFENGGTIAGTSAGAAALGNIMFVGGGSDESLKVGSWKMAPALGFHDNILIDNHFAERGRVGRLLAAVSLNPGMVGMGIDENTAAIAHKDKLQVIGENGIYMICGKDMTYTNAAVAMPGQTLSVHDTIVHILSPGERYDFTKRKPVPVKRAARR